MTTPCLETERLILRPLKIADAQVVYNNWATDPEVSKFMRWSVHKSIDETITWLTTVESLFDSEKAYEWGLELKESGRLVGSGGMYARNDENVFELGYCVMQKYWGLGIATEAAQGMIKFAVEELGERKFFATHDKENPASGKVLEKLGFVYQRDGEDVTFDGTKTFATREYVYTIPISD